MRKTICTLLVICMVIFIGCSDYSVKDAENIDKSRADLANKNMNDVATTATLGAVEDIVWVNGKNAKISEAGEGQTISAGGYELTVLESWLTDDTLSLLDSITGDDSFKTYLIKQSRGSYDDMGRYVGKGRNVNHLIVKMKIKCTYIENERRGDNRVCFNPKIFNKSSNNMYNMINGAEGVGFDKYNKKDNPGKDALLYTFKEGEEIETLMVMLFPAAFSKNDDIYMFSGFVNINSLGDGFNDVKDGTYMIKLNLKTQ